MKFGTETQSKHTPSTRRTHDSNRQGEHMSTDDNNEINLEDWVGELFNRIADASKFEEPFELTLSKECVQELAKAWDNVDWFEIY